MATIKLGTDLSQSKKLAETLPLESADMWWLYITAQGKYIAMMHEEPDPHYLARMESSGIKDAAIRCWSLAALLDVLPKIVNNETLFIETSAALWHIGYRNIYTARTDNPVDACYELILQLHKLKKL